MLRPLILACFRLVPGLFRPDFEGAIFKAQNCSPEKSTMGTFTPAPPSSGIPTERKQSAGMEGLLVMLGSSVPILLSSKLQKPSC